MKNNIPAFPETPIGESIPGVKGGMTLRDYLAAKVLQGVISGYCSQDGVDVENLSKDYIASECYKFADVMLAQREKEAL